MYANADSMQPRGGEETRMRNNLCLQSLSTARGYDGTEVSVSPLWGPNDPLICRGICVGDVGQVEKEISTQHGGVPGAPSRPSHDGPRTRNQRAGIAGLSGKWLHHPGPSRGPSARRRVGAQFCAQHSRRPDKVLHHHHHGSWEVWQPTPAPGASSPACPRCVCQGSRALLQPILHGDLDSSDIPTLRTSTCSPQPVHPAQVLPDPRG